MKICRNIISKPAIVAAALALSCSITCLQAQTPDLWINTFDTAASGTGEEWGPGTVAWDGSVGNPVGSLAVTVNFTGSSDTPATAYICLGGGNPWYHPVTVNFSQYLSLQFDILWDNTSDITIAEFNDLSTWPTTLTNSAGQSVFQSWAGAGYLAGSIGGLEVNLCGGPAGQMGPVIATTNIPAAASNGWTHIRIPINQTQAQIDGVNGIVFHKWIHQNWGILNPARAQFWIDNVMLEGTAGPPPPPTLSTPTPATPGLNVFASTEGNSFYDRQEVLLRQNTGLSWVGHATAANPVTYAFTIVGYPKSVNCEAYLFLVPNPGGIESAPDWNETNCAIAYLQGNASSATMHFQYKVNESSQEAMCGGGTEARGSYTNIPGSWDGVTPNYLESGNLGSVTNTGVLGTWTVKFTSDTNVTLIAPNGNTTNFVMPAYNAPYFAENTGFNVYLGMQANQADAMNQAVVYSSVAISGVASPYSENFLADSVLDTTTIWNRNVAIGPAGVLVVPAGAVCWVPWTLPATGFTLTSAGTLLGTNTVWNNVTNYAPIPMHGIHQQLISTNDLTGTNEGFFELVQRTFTQLQVLLPGETNAPNTTSGKTGTPTPISLSASGGSVILTCTVLAVDNHWNPIPGVTDTVAITDSGGGVDPNNAPLVNGSGQFTVFYGSTGNGITITATDVSNASILPNTSSQFNIAP